MSILYQHQINSSFRLVTPPTTTAILCAADLRAYVRQFDTEFDSRLMDYQRDAIEDIETKTGRQLITATWELVLDRFPVEIELRKPPIQSVESVQYVDSDGVLQTLDSTKYQVDIDNEPGRIQPAYGVCWPETRCQIQAVIVRFVCGYGDESDIPEGIKTAIKWYVKGEHNECDMMDAITNMLGRFQWRSISA